MSGQPRPASGFATGGIVRQPERPHQLTRDGHETVIDSKGHHRSMHPSRCTVCGARGEDAFSLVGQECPGPSVSCDAIVDALRAGRFSYSTEFDLHDGLVAALERAGLEYEREVIVTARDRIDLMCGRVAIEVKVDGNTASVRRQVERYTEHDQVDAVLLVTNRVRHNALAGECNGKPIRVYNLIHQAVA